MNKTQEITLSQNRETLDAINSLKCETDIKKNANKKTQFDKEILKIIDEIMKIKSLNNYEYYKEEIGKLKEDILQKEFYITVVGEFSSGKSTFLNAIIGKDVLPHGLKETTATLTYIHNVPVSDERINKVYVHFKDSKISDEIIELNGDNKILYEYVTTNAKSRNVVKEIAAVDIFVKFSSSDDHIVLVDTPGLNGLAEGHREITISEIKHSHASICLFDIRGVGKSDKEEFVNELAENPSRSFFFVINSIDKLYESNKETYESRLEVFRKDIEDNILEGKSKPDKVFGVSSLLALCSRDLSIKKVFETDKENLTDARRKEILKQSKFEIFESALDEFIKNGDKEKQFYYHTLERLLSFIEYIKNGSEEEQVIRQASIEDIPEKKILLAEKTKVEKLMQDYEKRMGTKICAEISDLEDDLTSELKKDFETEQAGLKNQINNINFETAENINKNNFVEKSLRSFWTSTVNKNEGNIQKGLELIVNDICDDISKIIPKLNIKDGKKIEFEKTNFDQTSIDSTDTLSKLRKEKENLKKQLKNYQGGESSYSIQTRLDSVTSEISQVSYEKWRKIQNLGTRPEVKRWTESVAHRRRKTGIWNTIKSWFGGDEYETYYVPEEFTDDSAQRDYDERKNEIEQSANNKINNLSRQKDLLSQMYSTAKSDENQRTIIQNKIERKEREIQDEIRDMEEKKKYAKSSFIREVQDNLKKYLDSVLAIPNGTYWADFKEGIRTSLSNGQNNVSKYLNKLYSEKCSEYKRRINDLLEKIEGKSDVKDNAKKLTILKQDIAKVNTIINEIKSLKNEL